MQPEEKRISRVLTFTFLSCAGRLIPVETFML